MKQCLKHIKNNIYLESVVITMNNNINSYINIYKKFLETDNTQIAYEFLLKYLMKIKASFQDGFSEKYTFGNISFGYMDFSYFPFADNFLKDNKLRFGIVLNHKEMQFELWLMGRNKKVQHEYWNILKKSQWNKNKLSMPKYSVLKTVLVKNPNFNNTDFLTAKIINNANTLATEITQYIKNL